ncbi:helix-turn-helix domain-containing protein [Roseomonas mucosa]|uniref:helix-turn-helix domain-containing protein n=1 Tax=Roseomonas mucosa TaxID=207340 RepID=UPI0028CCF650|nr:helix-turn-helix transcriptional regulator [Roseomonas mucosa]MDT8350959.1 helix-turn-helix transcriptional regulator [Roseomonas mucosa]
MPDALSESRFIVAEVGECVQSEHTFPLPHSPVSGSRLLAWLITLGWTERELARRTGRHQTTIRRWINGSSPIDPDVAAWLAMLAAFVAAHPGPRIVSPGRDASGR